MQQCSNNLHPTLPATAPMGKKVEGERQKVPDANSLTPKRRQFPHGFSMFLLQYKSGLYFRQILVIVISPTQQQQESSRSAETCRQGGQDKIKVRDSSSGLSWKKNRPRTHPPHRAAQRFPTSTSGNVACSKGTILGAILFTKENPRVMQPCSTLWSLLYWNCSTCLFNCYDTTVLLPICWLHNLYIERGTNIFFPGTKSADDQI